ncbi:hypothetical protein [Granulicella sp. L60]|uniref:hypothetical protein n=1 Tax=Granulicella sp. L60 TaxID=1641866 RepID=UPI00131BE1DC|nr:hypothetical protein [Granulicella sp. L60]
MNDETMTTTELTLNRAGCAGETAGASKISRSSWWKKRLAVTILVVEVCFAVPRLAHGQFLSVFDSIFSSIQTDMGSALKAINQIKQQVQQLYQTTMWPLAALNQARGFVSNSINTYRNQMNQIFTTKFSSAVLPGPQQFETLLHSRLSTQIPSLQTSFTTNYGAVPPANAARPQDRVMMDMDDALSQQNLKTTLIADQAQDVTLQATNLMENQVATSTPGSNPFLTAEAQIANLRCQAYMQKMLAAQLRQEAGRIAHDNALVKSRATASGSVNSMVTGALTNH